jgi:hypothetical protein
MKNAAEDPESSVSVGQMPFRLHSDMQNCLSEVLITSSKEGLCVVWSVLWTLVTRKRLCVSCRSPSASMPFTAHNFFTIRTKLISWVYPVCPCRCRYFVKYSTCQYPGLMGNNQLRISHILGSYFGPDSPYNGRSSRSYSVALVKCYATAFRPQQFPSKSFTVL